MNDSKKRNRSIDKEIVRNSLKNISRYQENRYNFQIGVNLSKAIYRCTQIAQLRLKLIGRRKLRMINNSLTLSDLRIPPSNHLEKLSGRMLGYYSIRINDQWRIIFKWEDNQALEVEIVDYH